MSRSRNVKPGTFRNELLAECEPLARILFIALWCEADRAGRMEDRPKRIKVDCLPYDDCDVDALLAQLAQRGFIVRYQVANVGYIAIPNFDKHQNPHMKEAASTIPAPCEHQTNPVQASEIPERAVLIPDSLNLIPDSGKKHVAGKPAVHEYPPEFERFWGYYPRKTGKAEAGKAWKAAKLVNADAVIVGLSAQLQAGMFAETRFTPHGATYLNGRRWQDPPERTEAPPAKSQAPSRQFQAIQNLLGVNNAANEPADMVLERNQSRDSRTLRHEP